MPDQSNALRLADDAEHWAGWMERRSLNGAKELRTYAAELRRLAAVEAESLEQARIIGMGAEREIALMAERDKLRYDLEQERMRLTACGLVALANTPASAAVTRNMAPEYRSAACDDVANMVDEQMRLRAAREADAAAMRQAIGAMRHTRTLVGSTPEMNSAIETLAMRLEAK